MKPTNDHERLIAQAVDEKFLEDPGQPPHNRAGHRNVPRLHHNVPLGQSILSPLRPVAAHSPDQSLSFKIAQLPKESASRKEI